MKTYIIEGIVTALSSISHNGGEVNGVVSQLRREKYTQKNGEPIEIPVISGNSSRGCIRDISAIDILTTKEDVAIKCNDTDFDLMFSGGHLESTKEEALNIEKVRKLREELPILAILGASVGNQMLRGKLDMGKMIPICKETMHLLPDDLLTRLIDFKPQSIWEYCQVEMYVRKDDKKDELLKKFRTIKEANESPEAVKKSQMMYFMETFTAGMKFYWKIGLRDCTDEQTGAFLSYLNKWLEMPFPIGGNGRIGLGDIKVDFYNTKVVDSEVKFDNDEFVVFIDKYNETKKDVSAYFEKGVSKTLFDSKENG